MLTYYDRRAGEYDATSWEHGGGDAVGAAQVRDALSALPAARTLDAGCGTGFASRWLPGVVTLADASAAMLALARRRLPQAAAVRATMPPLPFASGSFERVLFANFYGHFPPEQRRELVVEALRVAGELVVLEQLAGPAGFSEGEERRALADGSSYSIYKCYFTVERLLAEVGGGEVLLAGPMLAMVRRRR